MRKILILLGGLLVATSGFIYAQQSPGDWTNIGPFGRTGFGNGRLLTMDFHPTDSNTLYVGGYGGAWKTTDGGNNFALMNTDSELTPVSTVGSIAVDQGNPSYIYLTTGTPLTSVGEGDEFAYLNVATTGVYRSSNGGTSWTHINSGLPNALNGTDNNGYISAIVICPFTTTTAYLATDRGLYRTTNVRGTTPTWSSVSIPFTDKKIFSVYFAPGSTSGSYTAYITGKEGVISTTDFTNWTWITGTGSGQLNITSEASYTSLTSIGHIRYTSIDISPNDPNSRWIYGTLWGMQSTTKKVYGFLYKYVSGTGWVKAFFVQLGDFDRAAAATYAVVDPIPITGGEMVYTGGGKLYTWNSTTNLRIAIDSTYNGPYAHADHRYIRISPNYSPSNSYKYLYSCTDGFLTKVNIRRNPVYIEHIQNEGLNNGLVTGLSVDENNANYIMMSLMDDGTLLYNLGVSSPQLITYGDGFPPYIIGNNEYLYNYNAWGYEPSSHINNNYSCGHTMYNLTPEANIYPFNRNTYSTEIPGEKSIYIASKNLHKFTAPLCSLNYEKTVSSFDNTMDIVSLAIYERDPNIAYLARGQTWGTEWYETPNTKIYRTNNLLDNTNPVVWTELSSLPLGTTWINIRAIAVSSIDPNVVFVAYSNDRAGYRVKVSYDGGSTWVSYNSPSSIPREIHCMAYEPGSNDGIYVGTDNGLWYTNKDMSSWVSFNTELAKGVKIREVYINEDDNKITLATWGRGVWQNYLYCAASTSLTPSATITAPKAYDTKGSIESTGIIQNTIVTYRAGTHIKLKPGFKATAGSDFRGWIEPCGGPPITTRLAVNPSVETNIPEQENTENYDNNGVLMKTYPIPSTGEITIVFSDEIIFTNTPEFHIFDMKGSEIKFIMNSTLDDHKYELDLTGNQPGYYILKAINGSTIYNQTIKLVPGTTQPFPIKTK